MSCMTVEKPFSVVLVYSLALGAIYKASYRGLTKHIKRLQPEHKDEDGDGDGEKKVLKAEESEGDKAVVGTASEAESQPSKEATKPVSRWAKWQAGLAGIGMALISWGIGLLLGIGLPKIATTEILDFVWMLLVGYQIWIVYQKFLDNLLPDPRCLNVTWSRWNTITWTEAEKVYPGPTPKTTKRMVIAGILTLATLAGVYTGTESIIAFPIAALVYIAVSSITMPNRSVRSTLKWMVIYQVGIAASVGLVIGGLRTYRLYYPTNNAKPKVTEAKPSCEVLMLMMMYQSAIPLIVSGYLIALSLRIDYTRALQSTIITAPITKPSTKFVKLPEYPEPFFISSISTLGLFMWFYVFSRFYPNAAVKEVGLVVYALCVPATLVAVRMMFMARRERVWEEFMGYTELTKAREERAKDEMAVENLTHAPEEKSVDHLNSLVR